MDDDHGIMIVMRCAREDEACWRREEGARGRVQLDRDMP